MKRIKSNHIIIEDKEVAGYLYFDNGVIVEISDRDVPTECEYDYTDMYVSAGFIDIHTHGGGGYPFEGSVSDIVSGCNFHLSHGVTTVYPTISAAPISDMKRSARNVSLAMSDPGLKNNIIGAHLEGPYLSLAQTGAQGSEFITPPIFDDYKAFIDECCDSVARWTYAPENDDGASFARFISERGIVLSAGHTNAVYSDMKTALDNGCRLVTHLYSCTSTVTRNKGFRSLGVIESAFLEDDIYVEIIADGKHLPPELIRMIYKIKGKERVILVSDSLALAGTDVKTGRMQSTDFIIEDGVCKLLDRSAFAGSIATADRLISVVVKEAGIPLTEAVRMITKTPAEVMGLSSKGTLEVGKDADITVFDRYINVRAAFVGGKLQYEK